MSTGTLQDADLKTSGEAGADSRLNQDTQIYVTGNSLNKLFSDAVTNGDFTASAPTVITNATTPYSMTSTANTAVLKNTGTGAIVYQLPTASAGKNFTFVQAAGQRTDELQILPASSNQIYWGNGIAVNPGYLKIIKRGVQVTLMAMDSTTWVIQRVVQLPHEKNSDIGISDRDVSIVGRDTWVSKANNSYTTEAPARTSLNGYGYDSGGTDGVSTSTSATSQYNDSANSWTSKANLSASRGIGTASALNGFYYSMVGTTTGGGGNGTSYNDQYNDSANTFTAKATDPASTRLGCSSASLNGYMFLLCGSTPSQISTNSKYNDNLNSWSTATGFPSVAANLSFSTLNGYIYNGSGSTNGSQVYQYNDSSDAWIQRTNVVNNEPAGALGSLSGYVLKSGGNTTGSVNEIYNDATNVWTSKTNLLAKSVGRDHTIDLNGYSYLSQGGQPSPATSSNTQQYN